MKLVSILILSGGGTRPSALVKEHEDLLHNIDQPQGHIRGTRMSEGLSRHSGWA